MEIKGKTALITGAGSGIGRATAAALAAKGAARVYLVDREEKGARETAALMKPHGAEGVVRVLDIADFEALRGVFDEAEKAGGLDMVHNNAGMVVGLQLFPDTSWERLKAIIDVNIMALFLGTQLAIAQMKAKGAGVIVNTGSTAALHHGHRDWLYTATKAAVVSLSSSCAPLAALHNIRVNSVLPGLVNTPILLTTGDGELADYMHPILASNVALQPEDIAAGVIGLIEDDARAGEMLVVSSAGAQRFDGSKLTFWETT